MSSDALACEKARKITKAAVKKGYADVVARYENDVQYRLRCNEAGHSLRSLKVSRCLVDAVLPNPPRERALRVAALGPQSNLDALQTERPVRLCYLAGPAEHIVDAGLIAEADDLPFCFGFLGAFLSYHDLIRSAPRTHSMSSILGHNGETTKLDRSSPAALSAQLHNLMVENVAFAQRSAAKGQASKRQSQLAQQDYEARQRGRPQAKGQGRGKGVENPRPPIPRSGQGIRGAQAHAAFQPRPPATPPPRLLGYTHNQWREWYDEGFGTSRWDYTLNQWVRHYADRAGERLPADLPF